MDLFVAGYIIDHSDGTLRRSQIKSISLAGRLWEPGQKAPLEINERTDDKSEREQKLVDITLGDDPFSEEARRKARQGRRGRARGRGGGGRGRGRGGGARCRHVHA
eukprot:5148181-Pyramimonas_sp.AAC.1